MRKLVCDLERRVRLAKSNVEQISSIMAGWSQTPLYLRKDDRKDCLLSLEVIYVLIMRVYMYIYVHVILTLLCCLRKGGGSIVD